MNSNPNASVAVLTSAIGVGIAWLMGNVFHVEISSESSVVIAGAITAVVLFIGRRGVKGSFRRLWFGSDS